MTGNIVWLASYPKSGNTWLRVLLANYHSGDEQPVDINEVGGQIASQRHLFDEMVGVEASELSSAEVAACRAGVYRILSREADRPLTIKVHDAYRRPGGEPLFPADATACAVYVVRNPLDIAPSLAHHRGASIDAAVSWLCSGATLAPPGDRLPEQLEQVLLSWSAHVSSWADQSNIPVLVVRYEDLSIDPCATLATVLRFCKVEPDPGRVARAAAFSRFEELQRQERARGFRERSGPSRPFFRSGKAGGWREVLSRDQAGRIIAANRDVMSRYGYLDAGVLEAASG